MHTHVILAPLRVKSAPDGPARTPLRLDPAPCARMVGFLMDLEFQNRHFFVPCGRLSNGFRISKGVFFGNCVISLWFLNFLNPFEMRRWNGPISTDALNYGRDDGPCVGSFFGGGWGGARDFGDISGVPAIRDMTF